MSYKKWLLGLVLFGLAICLSPALGFSENRYTSKEWVFTVVFPDGWEVKELSGPVTVQARIKNETTSANMAISVNEVSSDVTIHQYYDKQGMEKFLKKDSRTNDLEKGSKQFGELQARWVSWSVMARKGTNEKDVRAIQYFFVVNGKAYILTGATQLPYFEQYKEIFENIARSFRPEGPIEQKPELKIETDAENH